MTNLYTFAKNPSLTILPIMNISTRAWVLLAMACIARWAVGARWIDVTDRFVTNPTFDTDVSGWTYTHNAGSYSVEYGVMEFWNGTFDISQTLTGLPEGTYRLSLQTFYRTGYFDSAYEQWLLGDEALTACLYAGEAGATVQSVFSWSRASAGEGSWYYLDGVYYPNDRQSANQAFEEGGYTQTLVTTVDASGELTIGLYCDENEEGNWCPFDNVSLEYYYSGVSAKSITLSATSLSMALGSSETLTASVLPASASQFVDWASSDESVCTVSSDGTVKAVGTGTAAITATSLVTASVSATCSVRVEIVAPTADQLVVNEVMVGNVDEFLDGTTNFGGWVEFYNPTSSDASLAGAYLSDEADSLTLWHMPSAMEAVPAGGYRVVWFDHSDVLCTQAPFKLDMDGGTLYVADSDGQLITRQDYPAGVRHAAYARTTDGGDTWAWTNNPTPGASNDDTEYATTQLDAPEPDEPSQLFSGALRVTVPLPDVGSLVYTTDGSLPTLTHGKVSTSGLFSVTSNTLLRLRVLDDAYIGSDCVTRTYILDDQTYTLPLLAVTGDDDYLYDDSIGIYVQGVNGIPGNGQSSACNWNQPWERPMNFSLIYPDGLSNAVTGLSDTYSQDVDMEIAGGWSRAWEPRSFKLKGSKVQSGDKKLAYPFFSAKPYINNRTLQIRNGGNDTSCRFIDPAIATIVQTSGIDIDLQSYQPVHEFLNGEYIGVLNMREPNNKHYVYANYGWDDEEIDQFEMSPDSGYVQRCGTDDAFQYLVQLSAHADDKDVYEQISQLLDIDEYLNYHAAEFYLASNDWTRNNVKGFRWRGADPQDYANGGKFRFVMYDNDAAFSVSDIFSTYFDYEYDYTFDLLYPSYTYITTDIQLVTLFRQLLHNDTFRRRFIDTFCIMGGSVFEASRCTAIIDSLVDNVADAMALEGKSVTSSAKTLKKAFNSQNSTMMALLQACDSFGLGGTEARSVQLSSDAPGARIEINGIDVPTGAFDGTLFPPVTLRAVPPAGYSFAGWVLADATERSLKDEGTEWAYYDQGSLDGTDWTATDYDDSGWETGAAPLGYGKDDIVTTMDYGGDDSDKRPTYYLRARIALDSAPSDDITLTYTVDDGCIVYVNGSCAAEYNMPDGTITYDTYAYTYADGNPDAGSLSLPAELFCQGENVIAVELHNNAANSSDIYWDAALTCPIDDVNGFYATTAQIALPGTGDEVCLTACYHALTDSERDSIGLTPLRINEVSAANDIYISDYGKKSDWVEIVNTTGSDYDLEGLYLTDNAAKPQKYPISGGDANVSTIIPAHGHRIIWCDKEDPVTQLHASFKLAAEGGIVQIMAGDGSWSDCLSYPAHDGNHTVGRYPDGTDSVYVMSTPTIGATNILTLYAEVYLAEEDASDDEDTEDTEDTENSEDAEDTEDTDDTGDEDPMAGINDPLLACNNGLRLFLSGDELVLRTDEPTPYARVVILTTRGGLALSTSVDLSSGRATVGLSPLPTGIYIARAQDSNGNRCGIKFQR